MCKLVLIDDNPIDHYIMRQPCCIIMKRASKPLTTFDGSMILEFMEENKTATHLLLPDVISLTT